MRMTFWQRTNIFSTQLPGKECCLRSDFWFSQFLKAHNGMTVNAEGHWWGEIGSPNYPHNLLNFLLQKVCVKHFETLIFWLSVPFIQYCRADIRVLLKILFCSRPDEYTYVCKCLQGKCEIFSSTLLSVTVSMEDIRKGTKILMLKTTKCSHE